METYMNEYVKNNVASFLGTDEEFGGLSNMSGDYPLKINGLSVRSTEHLYQALKFTCHPAIQLEILETPCPLVAKWVAKRKAYKLCVRSDWEEVKLEVMNYCLRAKLITHWVKFGDLLRSTGHRDIVEVSSKGDKFWGTVDDGVVLRGHNHLGRLLTTLRNEFAHQGNESLRILTNPAGLSLKLNCADVAMIDRRHHLCQVGTRSTAKVERMSPTTLSA